MSSNRESHKLGGKKTPAQKGRKSEVMVDWLLDEKLKKLTSLMSRIWFRSAVVGVCTDEGWEGRLLSVLFNLSLSPLECAALHMSHIDWPRLSLKVFWKQQIVTSSTRLHYCFCFWHHHHFTYIWTMFLNKDDNSFSVILVVLFVVWSGVEEFLSACCCQAFSSKMRTSSHSKLYFLLDFYRK